MSTPYPKPPTITGYRTQDGWRSGLATYAETGKAFQFFVSPSGQSRFYVWSERRGKALNGLRGRRRRITAALHQALAAMPPHAVEVAP